LYPGSFGNWVDSIYIVKRNIYSKVQILAAGFGLYILFVDKFHPITYKSLEILTFALEFS
jgi:hypothetical protein